MLIVLAATVDNDFFCFMQNDDDDPDDPDPDSRRESSN